MVPRKKTKEGSVQAWRGPCHAQPAPHIVGATAAIASFRPLDYAVLAPVRAAAALAPESAHRP